MGTGKERLLLSMKKLLHGFVHCFDGGYAFMDVCSQYSSTLNMYHLSYVCYIACQLYFNRAVKKDYFLKTEYTTHPPPNKVGFPSGSVVKNLPAVKKTQETRVWSLGWEDPLRRAWQPTPVFLPGESHGQRRLAGYSPKVWKKLDTIEAAKRAPKNVSMWKTLPLVCRYGFN